jgi:hypothetical protein
MNWSDREKTGLLMIGSFGVALLLITAAYAI